MEELKNEKQFDKLVQIVSILRSPKGCPWDQIQTNKSLREHLLEECYEVLQALDAGNNQDLSEELGDLLLQIIMHAQIAYESGEFGIDDVIEKINNKLVSRHPHVFGSDVVTNAEDVLVRWEELKKKEQSGREGALAGVPKTLPALAYSDSVQDRAARLGFDWPNSDGVLEKLAEEIQELKMATTTSEKAMEFGDVLFTLVNYARRHQIDPESALREANAKFFKRFSFMEELCRQRGLTFSEMSLEEQNELWEASKVLNN